MVILFLSERYFRLCGLVEYRNQGRRPGNRLYGWFDDAHVCNISDHEVILAQPQCDFEFLGIADYSKLVASAFQRRLKFRICDQLGAMRADVLVGKNFGWAISEQSFQANTAAKNEELISAPVGWQTPTYNYAHAEYGSQLAPAHTFPRGAE